MTLHVRKALRVLGLMAIIALMAMPSEAQGPGKADAPPSGPPRAVRKPSDPSRRVPPFFGQVGLTPEQRAEIYKARAKHLQRIDDLEKQFDQVRGAMLAECEGLLNETQKQMLDSRRRADAEKRKARARTARAPAASRPAARPAG